MTESFARKEVLKTAKAIAARGFALGTSGNISCRVKDGLIITPSGRAYDTMLEEDLSLVSLTDGSFTGPYAPSIEASMHRAIYLLRPDVHAIVHTHSPYAVAAASLMGVDRIEPVDIEAVLYLGGSIAVAPFAPPGSEALAQAVGGSIGDRAAVLLKNHGGVGVGKDMASALSAADHLERLCQVSLLVKQAGRLEPLPAKYITAAMAQYKEKNGIQ